MARRRATLAVCFHKGNGLRSWRKRCHYLHTVLDRLLSEEHYRRIRDQADDYMSVAEIYHQFSRVFPGSATL
jgi:hypothetical protein